MSPISQARWEDSVSDRKIKVKKQRQLDKRRESKLRRDSFSMSLNNASSELGMSRDAVPLNNAGEGHYEAMHVRLTGITGLPPLFCRSSSKSFLSAAGDEGDLFQLMGPSGRTVTSPPLQEILAHTYLQVSVCYSPDGFLRFLLFFLYRTLVSWLTRRLF